MVQEQEEQACRNIRRGVIICPGAIGDCLLTLPLANHVKSLLGLGGIDFIGHTEYIDYFPGRTCIDGIKSIESIEFHRLFADRNEFVVEDGDRLISSFSRYESIISFMGDEDCNFESNLIYTVNCSHPAAITMLPLKCNGEFRGHISEFYIRKFVEENGLDTEQSVVDTALPLLKAHKSDLEQGRIVLEGLGIDPDDKLVIIHPGSGGEAKCWHVDNYLGLADKLASSGVQVLFLAGPAESPMIENGLAERAKSFGYFLSDLDLTGVLQVFTWGDCFIGNDSGISHLAGGMGLATVAVFGPTNPDVYKPNGPRVNVFNANPEGFSGALEADIEKAYEIVSGILQN